MKKEEFASTIYIYIYLVFSLSLSFVLTVRLFLSTKPGCMVYYTQPSLCVHVDFDLVCAPSLVLVSDERKKNLRTQLQQHSSHMDEHHQWNEAEMSNEMENRSVNGVLVR